MDYNLSAGVIEAEETSYLVNDQISSLLAGGTCAHTLPCPCLMCHAAIHGTSMKNLPAVVRPTSSAVFYLALGNSRGTLPQGTNRSQIAAAGMHFARIDFDFPSASGQTTWRRLPVLDMSTAGSRLGMLCEPVQCDVNVVLAFAGDAVHAHLPVPESLHRRTQRPFRSCQ